MVYPLIIAVLLIVIPILFFMVFKSILRAIFYSVLLLIACVVVLVFFVAGDLNDLKGTFAVADKTFLVASKTSVVSGFSVQVSDRLSFAPIPKESLDLYQAQFSSDTLGQNSNSTNRLFVFNEEAIRANPEHIITIQSTNFTRGQLADVVFSDSPIDAFSSYANVSSSSVSLLYSPEVLRSNVMGYILKDMFSSDLVSQFQQGNIDIYPSSLTFDVARMIPQGITSKIFSLFFGVEEQKDGDA